MRSLRLGLLLARRNGHRGGLLGVASAVTAAIATFLLLAVLAGVHVVDAQFDRDVARGAVPGPEGQLLWFPSIQNDRWHGDDLTRLLVAPLSADAPVPPGMDHLPAAGEVVVSPRLAAAVRTDPDVRLRFSGRTIRTLSAAGLQHPDELIAYEGMAREELVAVPGVERVVRFGSSALLGRAGPGIRFNAVLLFVAFILVPFAAACLTLTRLAAAMRNDRYRALRTLGLPGRTVRVAAAIEAATPVVLGGCAGVAAFLAGRPLLAELRIGGHRHYASDLWPAPIGVVATLVVLVLLALVSGARAATRSETAQVGRRAPMAQPQPAALLVLGAGAATLAVAAASVRVDALGSAALLKLLDAAVVLSVLGIGLALPTVTMGAGRRLAPRASLAGRLAFRRLAVDAGTATRAAGIFAALVFLLGFSLAVGGSFHLSDDDARQRLSGGGRTIANVVGFDRAVDVAQLREADGAARVGAVLTVTRTGSDEQVGGALVGRCTLLRALSASPIAACPRAPTLLRTPGPVPNYEPTFAVTGGAEVDVAGTTVRWPVDALHLDAPWDSSLDGVLFLPEETTNIRAVRASGAIAVIGGDAGALDRFRAAVAHVVPAARVQVPGEGELLGNERYRGYGQAVFAAALMAALIGLAALLVTAGDAARARARALASLLVLGAPRRTIRRSCVYEVAGPLLVGSATALILSAAASHVYLESRDVHGFPSGQLGWVAAATMGTVAVLAIVVAGAASRTTRLRPPS